MTFMGKVLVLLNLVMTFFFMAFAMLVYTTRVDLRGEIAKREKLVTQANAEKQGAVADKAESDRVLAATKEDYKRLETENKAAVEKLAKERDDHLADLRKLKEDHEKQLADFNVSTLEMTQRKKEVDQVREDRNNLIKANAQLTTEKGTLQDSVSQLTNEMSQLTERNQQMADRLRQLEGFIVRTNQKLPTQVELEQAGDGPAPPPEVEGIVTYVDPTAKFIQLSLGADSGLQKGQVMEVWRTKPEPAYVGKIRIFNVEATTAVAKPVSQSRPIQPNDNFGPRVLNRAN